MSRLKCKYCGGTIKYNERKCPNCGADTSEVIDEYEDKLNEKREEINAERRERSIRYTKMTNRISIFMIIIFSIVFISISVLIITSFKSHRESIGEITSTKINEEVKSEKISVKIDEIKEFEMISDFNGYTDGVKKEGYKQMAFHLTIENLTNEEIYVSDIDLLADGIQMKTSAITDNRGFRHEKNGQNFEYISLRITSKAKAEGWVGFYVKDGTKELNLKCDNISITIDNPLYTE